MFSRHEALKSSRDRCGSISCFAGRSQDEPMDGQGTAGAVFPREGDDVADVVVVSLEDEEFVHVEDGHPRVMPSVVGHTVAVSAVLSRVGRVGEGEDGGSVSDLGVAMEGLVSPGLGGEGGGVVVEVDVGEAEAEVVERPFGEVELFVFDDGADGGGFRLGVRRPVVGWGCRRIGCGGKGFPRGGWWEHRVSLRAIIDSLQCRHRLEKGD